MRKALALIAVGVLVACGSPPPKSGEVVDKRYEQAHWEGGYRTEYRTQYRCHTNSEYNYSTEQYELKRTCGTESEPVQVYEPHHEWIDDAWFLKLQACKTDDAKRKCRSGWRSVTENRYDRFDVGDFYSSEGE